MKKYCNVCIYETLPYQLINTTKNSFLFHEGDWIQNVYHIDSGYVKVLKYYESGDEKIFDILGPGEFLGLLLALQEKQEYIVTAIALTEVILRKISVKDVLDAYNRNTLFQKTCMQCATKRANIFQNQLFQVASIDVDDKIIGVLMYLYRKFGVYKNKEHTLYLPITQTELANIIGIRRETLSRRIKYLQEKGVLSFSNHVYYFNRL